MSRYKIAWLPGDGVGVDVMDATRIVLDRLKFDAEYIHGDIGWEFWCSEGDALPARTIELLKHVDAALFGAITSKPVKAAEAELVPSLRGTGLIYRSPIVRMRQLFDLYICLRPIKAYPGNALNFRDGIDLVVFRENTEDLYAGVEFSPVPAQLAEGAERLRQPAQHVGKLARHGTELDARVQILGILAEYDQVEPVLEVQRVARVGLDRPQADVEIEQLPHPDDGGPVEEPLAL